MLPTDIKDLATAFGLLILFVSIGSIIAEKNNLIGNEVFLVDGIEKMDDNNELLLLSFLKTKIDDENTIYDLIINAEDDEEKFNELREKSDEKLRSVEIYNYKIKINYKSGIKEIGELESDEFFKIKIPDKNGSVILLEMTAYIDETPYGGYQ